MLQGEISDVFLTPSGHTYLIEHHIEPRPGVVICSCPNHLSELVKKVVWEELKAVLDIVIMWSPTLIGAAL